MTSTTPSRQELVSFLETRFTCAQACTDCARAAALRASQAAPDGTVNREFVRRKGIMCAEVCDATCRVLGEETGVDEDGLRVQLEWCRTVCLEYAAALAGVPGAEGTAERCHACAAACTDFLDMLG
ncbi:ferredoxin [Streptomyces sp. NPDC088387]|uniref:ferredoxin n=1 Tax=Streptomyces sp. NPDC088387 TaxID=3365859 RepID=UPI0037F146F4